MSTLAYVISKSILIIKQLINQRKSENDKKIMNKWIKDNISRNKGIAKEKGIIAAFCR